MLGNAARNSKMQITRQNDSLYKWSRFRRQNLPGLQPGAGRLPGRSAKATSIPLEVDERLIFSIEIKKN